VVARVASKFSSGSIQHLFERNRHTANNNQVYKPSTSFGEYGVGDEN